MTEPLLQLLDRPQTGSITVDLLLRGIPHPAAERLIVTAALAPEQSVSHRRAAIISVF